MIKSASEEEKKCNISKCILFVENYGSFWNFSSLSPSPKKEWLFLTHCEVQWGSRKIESSMGNILKITHHLSKLSEDVESWFLLSLRQIALQRAYFFNHFRISSGIEYMKYNTESKCILSYIIFFLTFIQLVSGFLGFCFAHNLTLLSRSIINVRNQWRVH